MKKRVNIMKSMIYFSMTFVLLGANNYSFAEEKSPETSLPPEPAVQNSVVPKSDTKIEAERIDYLPNEPRNLLSMRMHDAAFPYEASLRCGIGEACIIGLSRGFALGADVSRILSTFLIQPQITPGAWTHFDVFAGFQFLDNVDQRYSANGSLGYRYFSFRKSRDNENYRHGLYGKFNYAQVISLRYVQGLAITMDFSGKTKVNYREVIYNNDEHGYDSRASLNTFYRYSNNFPTLAVSLPADIEVINRKFSKFELDKTFHGYAHLEPFFVQNEMLLSDGLSWTERNVGSSFEAIVAYESGSGRVVERYALSAKLGVDASLALTKKAIPINTPFEFNLEHKPILSSYLKLGGSWQF